jgi:PAS domain S-box-containing protein
VLIFLSISGLVIALGERNRRTKAKLVESQFRFRKLIDSNIIPIVCANMNGVTEANDAFLAMIGSTRDELKEGKIDWVKMTPPEHLAKDREALHQVQQRGYCTPFEKEYVLRDGKRVPFLIGAVAVKPSPLEWLCFLVDLSELKRTEAELRETQQALETKVAQRTADLAETVAALESEVAIRRKTEQELRALSARLLRLQDEERRRIARDLHDSVGQTLTAAKLTLASLESLVANLPEADKLLCDLKALTDQGLQEVRITSHLLHPPMLDEAGFLSAAHWYADEFGKRSGIAINVELLPDAKLTKEAELVFFRILQESLTNVLRHSGSKRVNVIFGRDGENAVLSIRDYGRGIPFKKLENFKQTAAGVGVGLGGMKQRVRELAGHLVVQSDDSGTSVTARLPLRNTEHHQPAENPQGATAA